MINENTDLTNDESRELTSHVASMAPIKDGKPAIEDSSEIEDQGTNQEEAAQILRNLRDNAFDGSDEKLALALGRPLDEIQNWIKGEETIDSDVLLKAKAMANERGVKIE